MVITDLICFRLILWGTVHYFIICIRKVETNRSDVHLISSKISTLKNVLYDEVFYKFVFSKCQFEHHLSTRNSAFLTLSYCP